MSVARQKSIKVITLTRLGYGVVLWAIPYATSLALMPLMQHDPIVFQTIMIVEGSAVGAVLASVYFEQVTADYLREGVLAGTVWIAESWLLDFAGILPFGGLTLTRYFLQIGLRYLPILGLTAAIGFVLERYPSRR